MQGIRLNSANDSVQKSYTIPTHADFLYGYSCVEGKYSLNKKCHCLHIYITIQTHRTLIFDI